MGRHNILKSGLRACVHGLGCLHTINLLAMVECRPILGEELWELSDAVPLEAAQPALTQPRVQL